MTVSVRFDMNRSAVQRLLHSPDGPVARKVREVTERTATKARALAPVDDGTLRASIQTAYRATPGQVTGWVLSGVEHSLYVQRGTGIYGPTNRPIRPRQASVLAFRIGGRMVFATSVKGQRANPFFLEALRAESPWPVTALP